MAGGNNLARAVIERLSEDERLRGTLTDDGFGPLLAWAVAAVQQAATTVRKSEDMDPFEDRVRAALEAAVAAAEEATVADPAALAGWQPGPTDRVTPALRDLKLGSDADANAQQLAAILTAARQPPAAPASLKPSKRKRS